MPALPLRIVFLGSPSFAVASLEALLKAPNVEVVAVVSQPDRPAGRRRLLQPPAVALAARRYGLPLWQWTKLRDGQAEAALRACRPDALVVAAYGRILPPSLLKVARLGAINVHASLLPSWRGASPIHRAIWAGDAETGVSLMAMDEGLDTGPVYVAAPLPIAANDTTETLTAKLAGLGANLLTQSLGAIAAGTLVARAQPSEGVSLAPPLKKEDGLLDWTAPAELLARQTRALSPWPGTYCFAGDLRVAVVSATALPEAAEPAPQPQAPGTVVGRDQDAILVACGEGSWLRVARVVPAGRQEMAAAAWIAGRQGNSCATLLAMRPGAP